MEQSSQSDYSSDDDIDALDSCNIDLVDSLRQLASITHDRSSFVKLLKICTAKKHHSYLDKIVMTSNIEDGSIFERSHRHFILNLLDSFENSDVKLYLSARKIKLLKRALFSRSQHYEENYEELDLLGKGGCGSVYKARHKFDEVTYAIKKVPLKDLCPAALNEVKIIASIEHPNIINYRNSWFEWVVNDDDDGEISSSSEVTRDSSKFFLQQSSCAEISKSGKETTTDNSTSSYGIYFKYDGSGSTPITQEPAKRMVPVRRVEKVKGSLGAVLYIQMVLCESTLRNYIDSRNSYFSSQLTLVTQDQIDQCILNEKNNIRNVLIQLLRGLDYIHDRGIIHHDIKPSNIFMRKQNGTKLFLLGDFGLACSKPQKNMHETSKGTLEYAAPEQLDRKCTSKSDLYSLGLVLLELVQVFKTRMEKSRAFESLKLQRILDSSITKNWRPFDDIILRLTEKDPEKRPTAKELLLELESVVDGEIIAMENKERFGAQLDELNKMLLSLRADVGNMTQELIMMRQTMNNDTSIA